MRPFHQFVTSSGVISTGETDEEAAPLRQPLVERLRVKRQETETKS